MAGLGTSAAVEDYGQARHGALCTCALSNGTDLVCQRRGLFTSGPIHHDAGSLAIATLEEDSKVVAAWRMGSAPYKGQVQWLGVGLEESGQARTIDAEVAFVSVLVLSSTSIVYAYTDAQRNHEGTVVFCAVEFALLNCQAHHVFDRGPVHSVALAALGHGAALGLPPSAQSPRGDVIIAYEAGVGSGGGVRAGACIVGQAKLHCHSASAAVVVAGPTDGISVLALSATVFAVAYTDKSVRCPHPAQSRRRAQHVCTLADGHPSIGKVTVCEATFRGMGLDRPRVECAPEGAVVDGGSGTGAAALAASSDGSFLAAYRCTGCGDFGAQAWARGCAVSASGGAFRWAVSCGAAESVNSFATLGVASAAVQGGFVVLYDDYGGRGFASARFAQ